MMLSGGTALYIMCCKVAAMLVSETKPGSLVNNAVQITCSTLCARNQCVSFVSNYTPAEAEPPASCSEVANVMPVSTCSFLSFVLHFSPLISSALLHDFKLGRAFQRTSAVYTPAGSPCAAPPLPCSLPHHWAVQNCLKQATRSQAHRLRRRAGFILAST